MGYALWNMFQLEVGAYVAVLSGNLYETEKMLGSPGISV
jgi:hypothetical protein